MTEFRIASELDIQWEFQILYREFTLRWGDRQWHSSLYLDRWEDLLSVLQWRAELQGWSYDQWYGAIKNLPPEVVSEFENEHISFLYRAPRPFGELDLDSDLS